MPAQARVGLSARGRFAQARALVELMRRLGKHIQLSTPGVPSIARCWTTRLRHPCSQPAAAARALCESRHAESARTLSQRERVDSSVLCQASFPTRGSRWLRVVRSLRWRRSCAEALVGLPQDPPTLARAGNMHAPGCSVSDCQTNACVATIHVGPYTAERRWTVSYAATAAFLGRVQGQRRCCRCQ